jgi:hypothetical protein
MGRVVRLIMWATTGALVLGIGLVGALHFLPVAGAASVPTCPYNAVNNMSTTDYYYVLYHTSNGSIAALDQESSSPNYGGHIVPGNGEAVLNITGNMSVVNQIWCDSTAGHLSYWHVNTATDQLVRTAP